MRQAKGPSWEVRCFRAFDNAMLGVKSLTPEPVSLCSVAALPELVVIPNLKYLIPLALDDEHIGVPRFRYQQRKDV